MSEVIRFGLWWLFLGAMVAMAIAVAIGVVKRTAVRACRLCGCTDDRARDEGCSWVGPDLCSACDEAIREVAW